LVDDVRGDVTADQVLDRHQLLLQALLLQLLGEARRHLGAGLGHDLAGLRIHEVARQLDALRAVRVEVGLPALLRLGEDHLLVEMIENLLGLHAAEAPLVLGQFLAVGQLLLAVLAPEGEQQRGRRQLAAPVDAHIGEVLGVELEVEPRTAIGDDAGGEQIFARGVRLALVVVEEHAGRAVHLADDHPFRAVDDEGAVRRHERHVAHIDVLLLDVADGARAGLLVDVPDDQAQGHLQGRGKGHAALLALLNVVLRILELVLHELQLSPLREVLDREDRLEDFLKADTLAPVGGYADLQKMIVAHLLHFDQVRHPRDLRDAPETLANPLATGERLRHCCCPRQSDFRLVTSRPNATARCSRGNSGSATAYACWRLVNYFSSTFAPASSSFFLRASASDLLRLSLTAFGAPSTRSLASLRPRLVIARTSLITLILLAPASFKTTVNSVCSAAAAAPGAAAPGAAATATGAAAETPQASSSFLLSSAASRTVSFE